MLKNQEEIKKQKDEEELKECSFQPTLNKRKKEKVNKNLIFET